MRIAVLLDDRCQPKKCNAECEAFCPPNRNGIECIVMDEGSGKPLVSESLCIGCGICINKCPFDALIITNLPEELKADMSHRYSETDSVYFGYQHHVRNRSSVFSGKTAWGNPLPSTYYRAH